MSENSFITRKFLSYLDNHLIEAPPFLLSAEEMMRPPYERIDPLLPYRNQRNKGALHLLLIQLIRLLFVPRGDLGQQSRMRPGLGASVRLGPINYTSHKVCKPRITNPQSRWNAVGKWPALYWLAGRQSTTKKCTPKSELAEKSQGNEVSDVNAYELIKCRERILTCIKLEWNTSGQSYGV